MSPILFESVLVANRGEIAVRVIRTLRALGIRSIAVYSAADADARHVREADEAVLLGPAPARESYLDIDKVVAAAQNTGARAVHPGYGFLSENSAFAAALADAGIAFLGPSAHAIEVMGDKIAAKRAVAKFDVPVVPGIAEPGLTDAELIAAAAAIGYPVLVKPSAGGGGKGMRRVDEPAQLAAALAGARREAAAAFGDDTLFLERFVLRPRHIEVQILADRHGTVLHLGERECSLQRRHQKVIEEAPSPLLDPATRARIGAAACDTARSVDYTGAGTVEFIVGADRPDEFFFMEMNTRLQVEHPVTELVTGIDLVEWQIRIAAGEPLGFGQDDVRLTGHAIEARLYAEDPRRDFLPTGGTVLDLAEPAGPGIRVDSGLRVGAEIGTDYDPMLAKVISHADDRAGALRRLDRALAHTAVLGVVTNIDFLRYLLADADVIAGRLDTELLDRRVAGYVEHGRSGGDRDLIAAAVWHWSTAWSAGSDPWSAPSGWRVGAAEPVEYRLVEGARTASVLLTGRPAAGTVRVGSGVRGTVAATVAHDRLELTLDGRRTDYRAAADGDRLWLAGPDGVTVVRSVRQAAGDADAGHGGETEITSPMPGSVIAVLVPDGAEVTAGTEVLVVEAMKMEHSLAAPADGVLELLVAVGDQVRVDQLLARVGAGAEGRVNDD